MPRNDIDEKITGAAIYADDIRFGNDLLFARIKRSPHPHALVKSIDTSKAKALPGVKVVVTGDDFPGHIGLYLKDRHIFARDRVRFVGEAVAAWLPSAKKSRRKRWTLIEVEYELLQPVFDPEFGATPEAPLIHPDLEDYEQPNFIFPVGGHQHRQPFQNPQRRHRSGLAAVRRHCGTHLPHSARPARAH